MSITATELKMNLGKEPFYKAAMDIVLAISNRRCLGVLTAKSVTDVHYILRRSIHNEEEVRKLLRVLFTLFDVEDTFSTDCQLAIDSPQTAVRIGTECIVTRNLKDYRLAALPVYSPEKFLEELTKEHTNDE